MIKLDLLNKLKIIFDKEERKVFKKVLVLDVFMGLFESFGIAAVFMFMNTAIDTSTILSNKYLSYFYDTFKFTSTNNFLFLMGGLVLVLLIVGNTISAYSVWFKTSFVWEVNSRITTKLLKKYLFSPYTYFLNRNTSELEKNILSESNALAGSFLLAFLNIIEGAITTLIILIMLVITNPLVTLFTVGILVILYILIYTRFSKVIKATGREKIEEDKGRYKAVGEALHGIKYTKASGRERYFLDEYTKHSELFSKLQARNNIIGKVPKFLMEAIAFGALIGVILFSLKAGGNLGSMMSSVALFGFAGYRLLPALQSIYDSYAIFRFNKPVLDKIADDLTEKVPLRESSYKEGENKRLKFDNQIHLENISFAYAESQDAVLKNINLVIEKNTSVAFVGPTGSGKTTLVDILLGLLMPSAGDIVVDKTIITEENIKEWQRSLGYVPQDIYLCDDTIVKNIGFGIPEKDIDLEQVKKAAKMANISDFIENDLPEKYNTIVGERGVRLSGGQRQRIGIARALYNNPDILIFDEATSSLDNITERAVLEAIENISKLKTIIMIAHRLTTVEKCDKIFILEKGEIIAQGNYEYLKKNNQKFKEMANASK